MARYPLSHNHDGRKSISEFFHDILNFHVPPGKTVDLLDPTCGKQYLWAYFKRKSLVTGKSLLENYGVTMFSDIRDLGQNVVMDFRKLRFNKNFDAIVFDPPYFFGYEGSDDPRKKDYGDYNQTYGDLFGLMESANNLFPSWLKDGGKVILKCSDQYQPKERKFYPHHITWAKLFSSNFRLADVFIYIHHRMSPTAFQVKNRPCSVIMHTYFLVFEVIR